MITVKGKRVVIAGDGIKLCEDMTKMLVAVCTQIAKDQKSKCFILEKVCAAAKEAMERDDGIREGGGSDA